MLEEINECRAEHKLPPLDPDSVICHECYNKFHYASSQSSERETSSSDESDNTETETTDDWRPGTPPPFNPAYWHDADDAAPGPSSMANPPAPWQERCVLCPLLFTLNPGVPKHKICSIRPLQIIVNGELATAGRGIANPQSYICQNCFDMKINEYHYMLAGFRTKLPAQGSILRDRENTMMPMDVDDELGYESIASSEDNLEIRTPDIRPRVTLEIPSVAVTGHQCFVCGKQARSRPGRKLRMELFRKTGIYVSTEDRICKTHFEPGCHYKLDLEGMGYFLQQPRYEMTQITVEGILELINYLALELRTTDPHAGRLSFSNVHTYSLHDYFTLLGVTKQHFETLHNFVVPFMRSTTARSTQDALAIFLMKLRLNPSHNALACLFHVTKPQVSVCLITVRQILYDNFVPQWLGFNHVSREHYIQHHTTTTAKTITGASDRQAIGVIDGTYLYHQKSTNYSLQRKMFSPHKFRNLIKVMMITSTTGYILGVEGPHFGDGENNDSKILTSMMKDREGFRSFFMPGDYIIEDRGFRDSNSLMTHLGYSIKMPHFLGKRSQHPTSEANESRLVTKIRWIVEAVNGRIKNVFRFFRDTIPNSYIKNNGAYVMFHIACAMLNAFHAPIVGNDAENRWLVEQMLVRSEMHNLLQAHLTEENLLRQTIQWEQIEEDSLNDFPRLSMAQLREFTFGVYQLKQASSYLADTETDDGKYDIFFHRSMQTNAVRFRVQSRHQRARKYDLFIGYNDLKQGIQSITGWYCKCPNGSRVVGCCAHIASVIWYLSYARYCARIKRPAMDLASGVRNAASHAYEDEYIDLSPQEEESVLNITSEAIGERPYEESDSSSGSWYGDPTEYVPSIVACD